MVVTQYRHVTWKFFVDSTTSARYRFVGPLTTRVIIFHDPLSLSAVAGAAFEQSISLRVDLPERVDGSINWADDYAVASNWPPS